VAIVLPKFSRRRASTGLASETQPAVNVTLCRDDGRYDAGGQLSARWRVSRVPLERVQCMEISVLWHTEGKGDEDLQVHHFERLEGDRLRRVGLGTDQSLRCRLPGTPLSYHGRLIRIRWCIRLRLFMGDGREIVTEQPFHLVAAGISSFGGVRAARGTSSTAPIFEDRPPDMADAEFSQLDQADSPRSAAARPLTTAAKL
jgi:hypothetical protein